MNTQPCYVIFISASEYVILKTIGIKYLDDNAP